MTQHGRGTAGNSNRQIGRYELLQTLGSGGFAKVYLGKHVNLGTQAAIKVLDTSMIFEQAEQFELEAQIIASLKHPNIVRVLDYNVENNIPFLVMEYASHGSLRQRHTPGTPVPLSTVVSYVKQLARALQYAHDRGVIHRDVKPENMLLGPRDEVLLTDFGIAIQLQGLNAQTIHDVVGTLPYIAPEQIDGRPCEASDQYSLAIAVYEWLTGNHPFAGSEEDIVYHHFHTPPHSLRAQVPAIPPAVERVVMKALAKDPRRRYSSISKFAAALEKASRQPSPMAASRRSANNSQFTARRSSPLAASLLLMLFLVISGGTLGFVASVAHQATVTITPISTNVVRNYNLSTSTSVDHAPQHQVYARFISPTPPSQSTIVNTTGVAKTSGVQARGILTFYNGLTYPQEVNAGTVIKDVNGVLVVTDVSTIIPPINPPYLGSASVPAHALNVGVRGNIKADSINQPCCVTNNSIIVTNVSAFSGGQDPQPYHFVKQSDINGAVNSLELVLRPTALRLWQEQVRPGETLVASVQCGSKVISDHAVNQKATKVKVTVTLTCKGEVYDNVRASSIAGALFKADTLKRLGGSYILAKNPIITFLQAILIDAKYGTISLLVRVSGLWFYHFSNMQKLNLIKLIAGRRQEEARELLLKQPGVAKVDIQTPWWVPWIIRDSLPISVNNITLNIITF